MTFDRVTCSLKHLFSLMDIRRVYRGRSDRIAKAFQIPFGTVGKEAWCNKVP